MKKIFTSMLLGLVLFFVTGCNEATEYVEMKITFPESGAYTNNDVFDPLGGVTATGYEGEDISDRVVVSGLETLLLDGDNTNTKGKITVFGSYKLVYRVYDEDDKTVLISVPRFITNSIYRSIEDGLIYDGSFAAGVACWEFTDWSSELTKEVTDGVLKITQATSGGGSDAIYNHFLKQTLSADGYQLEEGKTYVLTFSAKSDLPKKMNVGLNQGLSGAPWSYSYGFNEMYDLELNEEFQEFTAEFTVTMPTRSDDNLDNAAFDVDIAKVTLSFKFGGDVRGEATSIYFKDISLKEVVA